MKRLRMSKRSMALSMFFAFAMTMLFAVAMDSRASIAATTSGQVVQSNKTDETPLDGIWGLIKHIVGAVVRFVRTVDCLYNTPPSQWDHCFPE